MSESVLDFIRNAGLVTVFTFLIVAFCVLIGFGLFVFARTTATLRWFWLIAILPVLSGILGLYLKFKYANVTMFGMASPQMIAANHREGIIDFFVGTAAGITILLFAMIRRRLNRNSNG